MKILIVCSNGLSTGILRFHLEQYSKDHCFNDEFEACGLNRYQEYDHVDMICIAPQVSFMKEIIQEFANKNNIQTLLLDEKDISLMNTEKIYQKIQSIKSIENVNMMKKEYKYIDLKTSYIYFLPIIFYLIFIWIYQYLELNFHCYFTTKPLVIFIYYCAIITSVIIGRLKMINDRIASLISITITALLMSSSHFSFFYHIPIFYALFSLQLYILFVLLIINIYIGLTIYKKIVLILKKKNKTMYMTNYNDIIVCLPITCVICFVMLFRQIMELF